MIVMLNKHEQRLAKYLAKCRYQIARSAGVENQRVGPQPDWQTDLEGLGAELAFCRLHNVYPDISLETYGRGDCYCFKLGAVDVKATKHQHGNLITTVGKADKPRPDCYALMIGVFPEYRYVGWATADELLRDDRIRDFGHGPTYAIPQKELNN